MFRREERGTGLIPGGNGRRGSWARRRWWWRRTSSSDPSRRSIDHGPKKRGSLYSLEKTRKRWRIGAFAEIAEALLKPERTLFISFPPFFLYFTFQEYRYFTTGFCARDGPDVDILPLGPPNKQLVRPILRPTRLPTKRETNPDGPSLCFKNL